MLLVKGIVVTGELSEVLYVVAGNFASGADPLIADREVFEMEQFLLERVGFGVVIQRLICLRGNRLSQPCGVIRRRFEADEP